MRRSDKEIIDPEEVKNILRRNHVCHLAMVDEGEPYVVPLTYAYDGACLYFHSAREGRKIDALRRNGRVCFTVFSDFRPASAGEVCQRSTRYRSVIGTGRAELLEDPGSVAAGLKLLMRQVYGEGSWDFPETKIKNILIIRVTIGALTGKRSGT